MRRFAFVLLFATIALPAVAAEKRYLEGKFGNGELTYVEGIPVLVVQGTREEIGTQFGELALKPAKKPLVDRVDPYMEKIGWGQVFPTMVRLGGFVYNTFPKANQKEIAAAAKAAGVDRDLLTTINAIPDLATLGGCSTLVIEPARSTTGGLLFGRNLDWPPFESLPDFTLVVVFRPKEKHAFAAVTFPVLLGALSGMNDAGLSLAINSITATNDQSAQRNITGTPMMFLFRKILEECTTVAEAEAVLKAAARTTWFSLTVCDKAGGCVFEATPKSLIRRSGEKDVCCCTNHFRSEELSVTRQCPRYSKLEAIQQKGEKLGVAEVAKALDAVNQGEYTGQSMIFEPATRVLHLAYGGGKSATEKPMTKLDLTPFLAKK